MQMVVVMVVMEMVVVSSRKHGSLRLRGLRILGANRCAPGRTLGGTEPVIRKSGNCCSTLLAPTLLPLHFPRVSEPRMPTPEPLLGPACTPGYVHMRPSSLLSSADFEPGNCWCEVLGCGAALCKAVCRWRAVRSG